MVSVSTYLEAGTVITRIDTVYSDGVVRIEDEEIVAGRPTETVSSTGVDTECVLPEHTILPRLIEDHVNLGAVDVPDVVWDTPRSSAAERTTRALENAVDPVMTDGDIVVDQPGTG